MVDLPKIKTSDISEIEFVEITGMTIAEDKCTSNYFLKRLETNCGTIDNSIKLPENAVKVNTELLPFNSECQCGQGGCYWHIVVYTINK